MGSIEDRSFLHYWEPSITGKSFGHIALELPNGSYISFWPEDGNGSCDLKYEQCKAKWYRSFEEERKAHGIPLSASVYDLDVKAVEIWWENLKNTNPEYNVFKQNCATVVYYALMKGHPWFRENNDPFVKYPKNVFSDVRNNFNSNPKKPCGSWAVITRVGIGWVWHLLWRVYRFGKGSYRKSKAFIVYKMGIQTVRQKMQKTIGISSVENVPARSVTAVDENSPQENTQDHILSNGSVGEEGLQPRSVSTEAENSLLENTQDNILSNGSVGEEGLHLRLVSTVLENFVEEIIPGCTEEDDSEVTQAGLPLPVL